MLSPVKNNLKIITMTLSYLVTQKNVKNIGSLDQVMSITVLFFSPILFPFILLILISIPGSRGTSRRRRNMLTVVRSLSSSLCLPVLSPYSAYLPRKHTSHRHAGCLIMLPWTRYSFIICSINMIVIIVIYICNSYIQLLCSLQN